MQLIAVPERYDGASVSFFGWCVNRFEQTTVQLSADPADWHSAIWLKLDERLSTTTDASEPTYCRVKGTFRKEWSGHMGRWPAQISPVEDLVLYSEHGYSPSVE